MKNKGDGVQNKKLIILLSVLIGLIAILVVAILVVHNVMRSTTSDDDLGWEQKQEVLETVSVDCGDLTSSYTSGILSMDEVDDYYRDRMDNSEDNVYKIYLTICYANYMHYHGMGIDNALALLKEIEPLIEEDEDFIEYYDRMVVINIEAGDLETAKYYADLRDKLMDLPELNDVDEEQPDDNYTNLQDDDNMSDDVIEGDINE